MSQHEPLQPVPSSQLEELAEVVKSYEAGMTVEAAQYLLGRGLTQETVVTARLGVVGEDAPPAHQRYIGWLAIPYVVKGDVVQVRFRRPDWITAEGPKYGQPSGERLRLYGVDQIHEADDILHVTEGEFDSLILRQCGLNAVAFPGANSFQSHHGRVLAGFNRIWVWGDPDQAGAEFVQKITNRLPRSARGVRIRGGDVSDVYLHEGAAAIYNLVHED